MAVIISCNGAPIHVICHISGQCLFRCSIGKFNERNRCERRRRCRPVAAAQQEQMGRDDRDVHAPCAARGRR